MFHLSFSNRFEILLDSLLDQLGAEQPGPFGQRQVVVPSSALRRKLELAVADREGVRAKKSCNVSCSASGNSRSIAATSRARWSNS